VDPGGSHLEQLEVAERQLLVFAREINHLYQAERARAAELERALDRLRGSYLDMIKTLAFVVEAKDPSTRAHLQRTHDYAVALAEAVDPELAADEQLRYGFLLHDVGKVGIPEGVLNKPGPLDAEEWEVMRAHPLLGVQMVAGIKSLGSAVEVIRCHHERWDGQGYPTGLAGEAIPAGARVFSVADAFDAMTSDRAYRKALSFDQACQGPGPSSTRWWSRPSPASSLACPASTPPFTRGLWTAGRTRFPSPLRSPTGGLSPEPGRCGPPWAEPCRAETLQSGNLA
jgi:HD-GYP domain-containing protein (c-di-GMP phosphodiesterase class II)